MNETPLIPTAQPDPTKGRRRSAAGSALPRQGRGRTRSRRVPFGWVKPDTFQPISLERFQTVMTRWRAFLREARAKTPADAAPMPDEGALTAHEETPTPHKGTPTPHKGTLTPHKGTPTPHKGT